MLSFPGPRCSMYGAFALHLPPKPSKCKYIPYNEYDLGEAGSFVFSEFFVRNISGTEKHGGKKCRSCHIRIYIHISYRYMVYCCHGSLGCVFWVTFLPKYHGKSPLNHPFGRICFHFFQASNKQIPVPCVTTYFAKVTTNSFNPSFVLSKNQAVKFPWGWGMNNHSDVFVDRLQPNRFCGQIAHPSPQKGKSKYGNFHKKITQRRLCKITFPFDGLIF